MGPNVDVVSVPQLIQPRQPRDNRSDSALQLRVGRARHRLTRRFLIFPGFGHQRGVKIDLQPPLLRDE